ncbi:MAG: hypothetical protein H5T86_13370, partial [Armatimonadetes bacterium]|nr:hypothetical protein [Armatimonadota bacterium]
MGTSSSQRSPATPEWERVRELYRQPNPDPGEVAARIVQALDPATRRAMGDLGVAVCLDTALLASKQIAEVGLAQWLRAANIEPGAPPSLQAAAAARAQAQNRIISLREASR